MTLASFPELKKLPLGQKLKLADELWQAGVCDSMPVTTKQKKILDSRWASYRAGKHKRISLAELDRGMAKEPLKTLPKRIGK